jgi:hypothetical protein
MEERYQQAIKWADNFLSTTKDSSMQIRQGVFCHSLHTVIKTCRLRVEHSNGYAQYIAYRSIKEIKDKLSAL